jgi:hypothetical protein
MDWLAALPWRSAERRNETKSETKPFRFMSSQTSQIGKECMRLFGTLKIIAPV